LSNDDPCNAFFDEAEVATTPRTARSRAALTNSYLQFSQTEIFRIVLKWEFFIKKKLAMDLLPALRLSTGNHSIRIFENA
jgi:hypothetical protein